MSERKDEHTRNGCRHNGYIHYETNIIPLNSFGSPRLPPSLHQKYAHNLASLGAANIDLKLKLQNVTEKSKTSDILVEKLRSVSDSLTKSLESTRIKLARIEERELNHDGRYRNLKQGIKVSRKEVKEKIAENVNLADENSALRAEMNLMIDRNAASLDHIQRICDEKMGQERLLRQRLSAEVREARSAIMSMHSAVSDRNDLLNNLENKLGNIDVSRAGIVGAARARPNPNPIRSEFKEFDEILGKVHMKETVVDKENRRGKKKETREESADDFLMGVGSESGSPYRTAGGQAWTIN